MTASETTKFWFIISYKKSHAQPVIVNRAVTPIVYLNIIIARL